ncbi:MAG TPA: hypothetical protein VFW86_06325 [Candidatus Limnocylindrales bacterium]|jgi:hypothetical protein|nr:hypothetical protein [Candidatus Limnocylindrales bacterium]
MDTTTNPSTDPSRPAPAERSPESASAAGAGAESWDLRLTPVERKLLVAALQLLLDAEDDPETIDQVQAMLTRLDASFTKPA